jgi:hypothetical protein
VKRKELAHRSASSVGIQELHVPRREARPDDVISISGNEDLAERLRWRCLKPSEHVIALAQVPARVK